MHCATPLCTEATARQHAHKLALTLLPVCLCRCTLINSPLATNVTGQMKDILTTALGMLLFGGEGSLKRLCACAAAALLPTCYGPTEKKCSLLSVL